MPYAGRGFCEDAKDDAVAVGLLVVTNSELVTT